MTAIKKYKCPVCGQNVTSDVAVKLKNRYLHPVCFNSQMKAIGDSKKKQSVEKAASKKKSVVKTLDKIEEALSEEEFAYKKKLFEYVEQKTHIENNAKVHAMAKSYMKKNPEWTYRGMYNTVLYCWEYSELAVEGDGMGLIPFFYQEANSFIESYENTKDIRYEGEAGERVAKIRQPRYKPDVIDIESIGE